MAITGIIFGLFLYKNPNKEKKYFLAKVIISNILVLSIVNLILNSLWLSILYGEAFSYYLGIRLVTQLVLFPIYVTSIILLEKTLKKPIKKYLYKEEQD